MEHRWRDEELTELTDRGAADGVNADVAALVYASRLLGRDPTLVLHGGGNTSVKTTAADATGETIDVICLKGSGWDLATIEAPGLPALRLDPLRKVAAVDQLSDEAMVNALRGQLLDSAAPTPSVETLLHATLAPKFILHTHANAAVALTDQPNGAELSREVYGDRVVHIPYIMPGFVLAKAVLAAGVTDAHEGMILLKHGVFSFGDTAREAYDRMIELVAMAEARLLEKRTLPQIVTADGANLAGAARIAPILRGATARRDGDDEPRPFVLEHRGNPAVLAYLNREDVSRVCQVGVATPDHVIRTKRLPLLLDAPATGGLEAFAAHAGHAVSSYVEDYRDYFKRNDETQPGSRMMLDPLPRVVLVRGVGLFALGKTGKEARVIADLAETTMGVITDAEAIGAYEPVNEAETFEVEYWSLEQAKLAKAVEKPFARRVVVVTGGAGAIGLAVGTAFAKQGAEVVLLDVDQQGAGAAAADLGGLGLACNVTDAAQVADVFDRIASTYGGVDVVVSNAGAAWQGRIGEVDDETLRASFELNFFAHQTVAQHAVRIMRAQGIGGSLLFNVSKQAVNPGRDFGPYGLPKAALLALVRQYALDYGDEGIRSNGINADRIRSGVLSEEMIQSRSAARGVTEQQYMAGNILGREVTAEDVAEAFVALARARSTTGAILTVDGGNVAAALR